MNNHPLLASLALVSLVTSAIVASDRGALTAGSTLTRRLTFRSPA